MKTYSQRLSLPDTTGEKVLNVIEKYKSDVGILLAKNFDEVTRRQKIDSLKAVKNLKLSAILTDEQFNIIVPSTEREVKKPAKP